MRTFHGRDALLAVVVAAASLGATGRAAPDAPRQPAPRLYDITTARAVVDAKPVDSTDVFAPDDSPIYVWFRAEHCPMGITIHSVWYYLGSEKPLLFAEGSVLVDRDEDWGQFNFELAEGRRWSPGEYKVELRAGGVLLAEARFRVVAASTAVLRRAGFSPDTDGTAHSSA